MNDTGSENNSRGEGTRPASGPAKRGARNKPDPYEKAEQVEKAVNGLASLDPLLQHRSRLGACVLLSDADALSFSRLKELLEETDGNLGAQLRKLEDAGYVGVKKEFVERRPVSWYALTEGGRKALKSHLAAMEALIRSAKV